MKSRKTFPALFVAALAAFCVPAFVAGCCCSEKPSACAAAEISVETLPPLVVAGTAPAQGVAGAFVVQTPCEILVAGGALFPEKGPADGGKKRFYDTIRSLDLTNPAAWSVRPETLPVPAAYGVSDGGEWLGGENADGKLASCVEVSAQNGKISVGGTLPATLDNAAGANGFLAGGNANGVPANKAFLRRAETQDWSALPDFPGTPRVQPVAGELKTPRGNAFALVGGFYFDAATKKATLDRAGVIYFPETKTWEPLPPLPEDVSEAGLVGACAVADGCGGMLIFGGVNAKIFKDALENPAPDYQRHEPAWYKFNADILRLSFDDAGNARWENLATVPATARAGASAIRVPDGSVYFLCGELKPGFRSPDCVRLKINFQK